MSAMHALLSFDRIRGELRACLVAATGARLTLYLPRLVPPDSLENVGMRRQGVAEASKLLTMAGVSEAEVARRMKRLEACLGEFESVTSSGGTLVALEWRDGLRVIPLASQLPFAVGIGRSFLLRPLMRALQLGGEYRVLAVSTNHVGLYDGDARGLAPAPIGSLPASLEDALGEETTEKHLRMRGTRAGGGDPVYYAHDVASDERKIDAERFHHELAKAVNARFENDATPMVLAADVTHQAGLRALLDVPGLVEEPLLGSPDHWSVTELHRRVWPLVRSARASSDDSAAASFERARKAGKAVDLLDDVASAASSGRVRRLWIDGRQAMRGALDRDTGRVRVGEGNDDLLDELVELVLIHGGEVHVIDDDRLPGARSAAAELR